MNVSPKRGPSPLRYLLAFIPLALALLIVGLPQYRHSVAAQLPDAVRRFDPGEVADLLHRGAPADSPDGGSTPLDIALGITQHDLNGTETQDAAKRREQIVASLLKAGADPNGSSDGMSHLANALLLNSLPIVKDLLAHGADPNSTFQGDPLLMYAVAEDAQLYSKGRQDQPLLTAALHSAGADVRIRCLFVGESRGRSVALEELPLIVAIRYCTPGAVHKEDPALMEALLSYGVDVNGRDHDGRTALSFAAAEGDPGNVRVLLANGANPRQVDREGYTPLQTAQMSFANALAQDEVSKAGKKPLLSHHNYSINASNSTEGSESMNEIKTRYNTVESLLRESKPESRL